MLTDPPGLVAGEQVRRRSSGGFILEVQVGQSVPVGVADDEVGLRLLD
jgi:hypothetical protein